MEFVSSNTCPRCGFPHEHDFGADTLCSECIQKLPEFDKAKFIFKYNDFSSKLITLFKYADKTHYSEVLSELIASTVKSDRAEDFDIVTSVPISRRRLIKRKFNQSAILANKVGSKLGVSANNLLISRMKNIPPQTGLKRKDRLKNIKGAFNIPPKYEGLVKNSRVLLIDDVYTTGATINECSKMLKKAGAEHVFVITLARTFIN